MTGGVKNHHQSLYLLMVYLQPNTSNQSVYLSLFEGRCTLADFSHYMVSIIHEENSETGSELNQVPTIVSDGSNYSNLTITTVGITQSGRYRYIVYGQNSSTNTDAEDASVVGIVEIGYLVIGDIKDYYDIVQTTSSNDIIIQ